MRKRWVYALAVAAAFGLAGMPTGAQQVAMTDLLFGKVAPLTVTVQDMTAGWLQVKTGKQQLSFVDFIRAMESSEHVLPDSLVTFTRGHTVTCGGQTYLIAYRFPEEYDRLLRALRDEDEPRSPERTVTPDTALCLTLLNLKDAEHLQDFSPVDPAKLVTGDKAAAQPTDDTEILTDSAREKALKERSISNLRQLTLSANMYCTENEETLPTIIGQQDIARELQGIASSILISPISGLPYRFNYALSGKGLGQIAAPHETVIFYDEPDRQGGRCAGFVDGHVAYLSAAEWTRLQRRHPIE